MDIDKCITFNNFGYAIMATHNTIMDNHDWIIDIHNFREYL